MASPLDKPLMVVTSIESPKVTTPSRRRLPLSDTSDKHCRRILIFVGDTFLFRLLGHKSLLHCDPGDESEGDISINPMCGSGRTTEMSCLHDGGISATELRAAILLLK